MRMVRQAEARAEIGFSLLQCGNRRRYIGFGRDAPAKDVPDSVPMAEHKPPSPSNLRVVASDGSVVIRDERCAYTFRWISAGVVEVRMVGTDSGQFGMAVIDEVALALFRERSLELFVDATEGSIMSVNVTTAWARFYELNREGLRRVTILATTKPMTVAMGLVRYLSKTGDLLRIVSDTDAYEARKASLSSPRRFRMGGY